MPITPGIELLVAEMSKRRDTDLRATDTTPVKPIAEAVVADMAPRTPTRTSDVRGSGIRYRARHLSYLVETRISGRQCVLTIGRHGRGAWGPETARREAVRLLRMIRDGRGPAADRDQI